MLVLCQREVDLIFVTDSIGIEKCVSYYIPRQEGFFCVIFSIFFKTFSTAVMLYCRLRWILIVQLDNKPENIDLEYFTFTSVTEELVEP